jgi:hypothetical protein
VTLNKNTFRFIKQFKKHSRSNQNRCRQVYYPRSQSTSRLLS